MGYTYRAKEKLASRASGARYGGEKERKGATSLSFSPNSVLDFCLRPIPHLGSCSQPIVTQDPQALWAAIGRQKRPWRIRKKIIFLIGCAVIKFQFPRVSPSDQPLAKEPEDSGYEIADTETN